MSLISASYSNILKPFLFRQDPEDVHDRFVKLGNRMGKHKVTRGLLSTFLKYENPSLEQNVLGINFKNPIGLAAGFDKDGKLLDTLESVGFGFSDVGSVTYQSYVGNPKPRLYRLPNSKALVVYYGLKNDGAEVILNRIKNRKTKALPLVISIAKTNCDATSTSEGGIKDYVSTLKLFNQENVGEMYEINISCPNTFGGEPFTTPEKLESLLREVSNLGIKKPLTLKMPINLTWEEYSGLLEVAIKFGISGVVIGNLTKVRDPELIKDEIPEHIKGGISGLPTQVLSDELIFNTFKEYGEKLKIIGVGGVFNAEDAYRKIRNGASLVSMITGMIYGGPQVIGEINRGLVDLLRKDGYENISEAIGSAHKMR